MAAFLAGADGVVDQAPKSIRSAARAFNLSTTPPLAIKNILARLPLLSRRGNVLGDTVSLRVLGQVAGTGADGVVNRRRLSVIDHPGASRHSSCVRRGAPACASVRWMAANPRAEYRF